MASNGSPICKKYLSILEADANVVLTRQNCRVNTVGNSSMTIYNKMVGATVAVAVSIEQAADEGKF